jgi:hypothetical protein
MTLNKKVINYKIVSLINLYNFGIKFDLIQDHMKKMIFLGETICRDGHAISKAPKNAFTGAGDGMTRPWKWPLFPEAGDGVTRP